MKKATSRRPAVGISRRALLGGLIGSGLAPLLARLHSSGLAHAAPGEPRARRFIGVYAPHGVARELWAPGPRFDLRYPDCSLAPFDDAATYGRSFREHITIIEGLDLSAGIEAGTVGHEGARVMLTGSAADGDNPSIDQFLALECGLGASTPFSSLVLGVGANATDIGSNISYQGGGRPVPKRIDPSEVHDSVFGAMTLPSDPEAAAKVRAQRALAKSSLDFLMDQVAALRHQLPAAEAQKLDQHLTAQREIERRLAHFEASCRVPELPAPFATVRASSGGARFFDAITNLMIDLLAQAMACDLTRFATLFLNDLSRTHLIDGMPEDIHFDVSHRYRGRFADDPGRPETWLPLARQNRYSHGKLARLMQRLDERGLLADTLVYASSDMGDPSRHSSRAVPTLVAGGGLRGGRHLVSRGRAAGSNNHLLVSICRAFGVPVDSFGQARDADITTGPLTLLDA
ncbi:MAG TPA: DUF1552 domain-containing protein [Polyangiaceae bacterium]|nr:DUF1552 domain-containing protein [Polyangiaceae bacterium]